MNGFLPRELDWGTRGGGRGGSHPPEESGRNLTDTERARSGELGNKHKKKHTEKVGQKKPEPSRAGDKTPGSEAGHGGLAGPAEGQAWTREEVMDGAPINF